MDTEWIAESATAPETTAYIGSVETRIEVEKVLASLGRQPDEFGDYDVLPTDPFRFYDLVLLVDDYRQSAPNGTAVIFTTTGRAAVATGGDPDWIDADDCGDIETYLNGQIDE